MEAFTLPGAGAIIERMIDGRLHILMQRRDKADAPSERGLLEIPAGKVRAFESVYDCLRREVLEETGLDVVEILGEEQSPLVEQHGYRALSFRPFACTQNLAGTYPIMVMVFICRVQGNALCESDESKQIHWMPLTELPAKLEQHPEAFYPMHLTTLRQYAATRDCSGCHL